MKYLKLFENFNQNFDEDLILSLMKEKGWGDLSYERIEDFQNSDHYKEPKDEQDFADQFDDYLWFEDSMDDEYLEDESNVDLSIELENKLRNLEDDSELTVDDFLEEFGVDLDTMTGFGWTAILKGAEKYKDMSDEEFSKAYDEYKNSVNESKKSGVTASLKKKSKASGIPMGILRKVFAKGMQAWNAGHRPGVAQHQWGMGRVNSFITGSGGARKADADLWAKAKAAKARKKKSK
jgi:hypothetical protein